MEIAVKGLSKNYGSLKALEGISLTMSEGLYGLLGPNGAGKSTFLRILATILKPDLGAVICNGTDIVEDPSFMRRLIGYLPQSFSVYRDAVVEDYLEYVGALKGLSRIGSVAETRRVLEIVGLSENCKRKIKALSGGMTRRLGIAQVLIGDPAILILDEPTAWLDPEEQVKFRNLLSELSLDRIVLLSTHIVPDIEATCSEVFILNKGRLLYSGEPKSLAEFSRGQVWSVEMSPNEYRNFNRAYDILNICRNRNSVSLRILSGEPIPMGVLESPSIEHGYTCLLRQREVS